MSGVSKQTKKQSVRSCVEPPEPNVKPNEVPYLPEEPSPSDTETTQSPGRLRGLIASWFKPQDEEEFVSPAELSELAEMDPMIELAGSTEQPSAGGWKSPLKRTKKSASEPSQSVVVLNEPPTSERALKPQSAYVAQPARLASTASVDIDVSLDGAAKAPSSKKTQSKRSAPGVVLLED